MDFEQKRQRIEYGLKIAAVIGICFLLEPIIGTIFRGILGMAGTIAVSLVMVNVAPVFCVWLANKRLQMLKYAASLNPIETLENESKAKHDALEAKRDNIKQLNGVVQDLWAQIQEHDRLHPENPSQYLEKYRQLRSLLALQGEKFIQAKQNLAGFDTMIDEKRMDWKIAQTAAKATKLAKVGEDFQAKLLQDSALTTIQDGLNMAFSELDASLLDAQADQKQIAPKVITASIPRVVSKPIPALADAPPTLDLGESLPAEAELVPGLSRKRR